VELLPETMASPRLTLRRWVVADGPSLSSAVLENLEHLRPWMPWIAVEPQTPADRLALMNQWQTEWEGGGDVVVGAFLDGAVVGSAGLHRRRGPGVLEVGYWVDKAHLRKGFATEIAETLTTAAFTVTGIDRVEIHHDKANIASAGVPRRLGFTFVDEVQNSATSPGEVGIDCRWAMARQQWSAIVAGRVGSEGDAR
jgi:ribosomal-protein-serine acetyltransferase